MATPIIPNTSGIINADPSRSEIWNEPSDQLQPMSGKRPNGVRPLRPIKLTTTPASAMNRADHHWRGNINANRTAATEHEKLKNQIVPSMRIVVVIKRVD
jgi:hypothetical protein